MLSKSFFFSSMRLSQSQNTHLASKKERKKETCYRPQEKKSSSLISYPFSNLEIFGFTNSLQVSLLFQLLLILLNHSPTRLGKRMQLYRILLCTRTAGHAHGISCRNTLYNDCASVRSKCIAPTNLGFGIIAACFAVPIKTFLLGR